jgi:hypothetical protein
MTKVFDNLTLIAAIGKNNELGKDNKFILVGCNSNTLWFI